MKEIAPNTFEIEVGWGRTPANVEIYDHPAGAKPMVSEITRYGFKVQFFPESVPVKAGEFKYRAVA